MSINTPKPIKQLAVANKEPNTRTIRFHATDEVLERIKFDTFGSVEWNSQGAIYEMVVNPLYEFEAVANWLEALAS